MTTKTLDNTTTKTFSRRGITFTKLDPIQNIIEDLLQSYGNALDVTSITKIALIEHWKNQTSGTIRTATKEEASLIDVGELSETLDYKTTQKELAKFGLKV